MIFAHELSIAIKDDYLNRVSLHTKELFSFLMNIIDIQHCLHLLNQALLSAVLADEAFTTLHTFVAQLQHMTHAQSEQAC